MPAYHWARPFRGDDLDWRLLVTAQNLSGPVLTLKLCHWNERSANERAKLAQADGLGHCPPNPWINFP